MKVNIIHYLPESVFVKKEKQHGKAEGQEENRTK
jgi:hypothetical protein